MMDNEGHVTMARLADLWRRTPQPEIGACIALLRSQFASRKAFIDRMADVVGEVIGADDSLVYRWERGQTSPGARYRSVLESVCRAQLEEMSTENRREFLHRLAVLSGAMLPVSSLGPPAFAAPVKVSSPGMVDDVLSHLREQWHVLVRADNLLGPRHAVRGVLDQLAVIEGLLTSTAGGGRHELVRIAARYAESASWLHEDCGDSAAAQHWNFRAMQWAHEANDPSMLAWTLFRSSQQALPSRDAQKVVALASAAIRVGGELPRPMRAAIAQQLARGSALGGDESRAHRMLDEAHRWAAAAPDAAARGGHGAFCTAEYIEVQRAGCLLHLGEPERAARHYEVTLRLLPQAFRRDRATALVGLGRAYADSGDIERAATSLTDAASVADDGGCVRALDEVCTLSGRFLGQREQPSVARLLERLSTLGREAISVGAL